MPLNHAKHNYKVCHFLWDNSKYNDWIVTTAYYSAIYFVYHNLFPKSYEDPISGNIRNFNSFQEYCKRLPYNDSKHRATEDLVSEHLPEIYAYFKTLKDICWTARYDDYQIEDVIVNECIDDLEEISTFCTQ
ncbi:hypothetical protein ES705_39510 [subsurface metagenome]